MDKTNKLGMTDDEVTYDLVKPWRKASPKVTKFWKTLEKMALAVVESPGRRVREPRTGIILECDSNAMWITLPSGRRMAYWGAHIGEGRYGPAVQYFTMKEGRWTRTDTYGGKLFENVVQAFARDLLSDALLRVDEELNSYTVCVKHAKIESFLDPVGDRLKKYLHDEAFISFHVHDELIVECDERDADQLFEVLEDLMTFTPEWAKGLPLSGDGFISRYYKK